MPDYAVYGRCLRSTLPIPELRLTSETGAQQTPSWYFESSTSTAPDLDSASVIGQDELVQDVRATFLRSADTLRLQFDDTGVFDLHDNATRIVWYRKDGCEGDVARADLIGRVLPLAQHERGELALHASAVCIAGRAIGFMAPKNYGKSSLAVSLVTSHNAKLLTDDTLIVSPGTAVAAPGVHSVRLWQDTAGHFDTLGASRPVLSDKRIFEQLPDESLEMGEARIDALYTLVPTGPDSETTVRREALDGFAATMALIQYQKLGPLLGGPDAARVFDGAATLATRTAVYALHIARDFARLSDAARSIAQWHTR
jgi:hypothetical protein